MARNSSREETQYTEDVETNDESKAATITISDMGSGKGYYLALESGVIGVNSSGAISSSSSDDTMGFSVFSVTYHS